MGAKWGLEDSGGLRWASAERTIELEFETKSGHTAARDFSDNSGGGSIDAAHL
jgi:hypothetical protein